MALSPTGLDSPSPLVFMRLARDAVELEVGLDGVGAAPRQIEVVLVGAGRVGVALDLHLEVRVRFEQLHHLFEGLGGTGLQIGLVGVEVDAVDGHEAGRLEAAVHVVGGGELEVPLERLLVDDPQPVAAVARKQRA